MKERERERGHIVIFPRSSIISTDTQTYVYSSMRVYLYVYLKLLCLQEKIKFFTKSYSFTFLCEESFEILNLLIIKITISQ